MRKRFLILKNFLTIILLLCAIAIAGNGLLNKIDGFSTSFIGFVLNSFNGLLEPLFGFFPDNPQLNILPFSGIVLLSAFLIRCGIIKELLFLSAYATVRPLILGFEYSLIPQEYLYDYFKLGIDFKYYYYGLLAIEFILFILCIIGSNKINKKRELKYKNVGKNKEVETPVEIKQENIRTNTIEKQKKDYVPSEENQELSFEDSIKLLNVESPNFKKIASGERFSLDFDEEDINSYTPEKPVSSVSSGIFETTRIESAIREETEKRRQAELEAQKALENSRLLQEQLELERKRNKQLARKREIDSIISDSDKSLFSMPSLAKKFREDKKAGEVFSAYESGLKNVGAVFNSQLPKVDNVVNPDDDEYEPPEELPEDNSYNFNYDPKPVTEFNNHVHHKETENTDEDIDYVSGIGGLQNSNGQKSYLLDRQRKNYNFPPSSYLKHYDKNIDSDYSREANDIGQKIVETLAQFKVKTTLVGIQRGPTVTMYELSLAPGIRITVVFNLADNIAMQLAVPTVRILAPIPGKKAIGVEVPNKMRDIIGFDEMLPSLIQHQDYKIPMALGKEITGQVKLVDVSKTPHLLIAGTTGSGKSVCVNSLICSILYTKSPKEVRMIMVDPKMVELSIYNDIPHLLTPVITDPKKAIKAMGFVLDEMDRRMKLFKSINARKIEDYNRKIQEQNIARVKLPYILLIIDEFADLISVVGKELEGYIKRITAMARFTGIHLVLATQRPSADIITGVIKSNIPTRIGFFVSNAMNSRIILDTGGAEKLLGKGDMLFVKPGDRVPTRIQGSFIDSEIENIVNFVKTQGEPDYLDECIFEDEDETEEDNGYGPEEDLNTRAWYYVAERGEASTSYLQRKLGIGYNKAANIMEDLEDRGIVGPPRGSKAREVLRFPGTDKENNSN